MAIIDEKRAVFGQIAALRTLNEGFPKFNLTNSFPSLNNGKDSISFLSDLLKALVGFEELRNIVVDTLTYDLDKIEGTVKVVLKKELKKLVSCGVDPSIPSSLKHQTVNPSAIGVDLELRKIDFTGIMFIDPQEDLGKLYYEDPNSGINSTDFNTFLYNTVQTDTVQQQWGNITSGNDILSVEFNSVGVTNNLVNVRASAFYSEPVNNKTLTDLNNDYIDSVSLFKSDKIISSLVDTLFGSVSANVKKSRKQLEQEAKVDDVIQCILNSDENDVIDNSYFTFTNEEISLQEETANNRRKGIQKLATCNSVESSIPVESLLDLSDSIATATTKQAERAAIDNSINLMGDQSAANVGTADKYNVKLSFIDGLIKKLTSAIVTILLSPKVIMIFSLNNKIIHGSSATFDGPIDFMQKNKTLIRNIINGVRDAIVQILLQKALIAVKDLVATAAIGFATEKANFVTAQLLSLVGVPQDVLRVINNLT